MLKIKRLRGEINVHNKPVLTKNPTLMQACEEIISGYEFDTLEHIMFERLEKALETVEHSQPDRQAPLEEPSRILLAAYQFGGLQHAQFEALDTALKGIYKQRRSVLDSLKSDLTHQLRVNNERADLIRELNYALTAARYILSISELDGDDASEGVFDGKVVRHLIDDVMGKIPNDLGPEE